MTKMKLVKGYRNLMRNKNFKKTKPKPTSQKLWISLLSVLYSILNSYFESNCQNVKSPAPSKGCITLAHSTNLWESNSKL